MRRKVLLITTLFAFTFSLLSCEDHAVSSGRKLYENYFKERLKDPESFTVYKESYTKLSEHEVEWTIDYGAKNSFGGMVRETAKFTTVGNSVFMKE